MPIAMKQQPLQGVQQQQQLQCAPALGTHKQLQPRPRDDLEAQLDQQQPLQGIQQQQQQQQQQQPALGTHKQRPRDDLEVQLDQQQQEAPEPLPPLPPPGVRCRCCCECVTDSLHSRTVWYYAPYWVFLIVDGLLGSVSLFLLAIVCTGLVAAMLVAGQVLKRAGLIRVSPKSYDLFNFCFFLALIPLAVLQRPWLRRWIDVLSSMCNTAYMLASIIAGRCWPRKDGQRWHVWNFVEEAELDRLSDAQAADPVVAGVVRSACLHAALGWAGALSFMSAASVAAVALGVKDADGTSPAGVAVGIALMNGPLVLALVWHCVVLHRGRRRLLHYQQQLEQDEGSGGQGEQQQQQQERQQQQHSEAEKQL